MTLTSLVGRPCGHIAQIIPNRLYFGSFYEIPKNDDHTVHVNIDDEVHYHAFYNDFGPVNLGELHKACLFIDNLYKVRVNLYSILNVDSMYHTVIFSEQSKTPSCYLY